MKTVQKDYASFPILREALLELLNQFPGLDGDVITYQDLGESSGVCLAPENSPVVLTEREDIIGNVYRTCQFSFLIIYRTDTSDEYQKLRISKFLEDLAAWVCKDPVESYAPAVYPELTGGRSITGATRSNVYAYEENENKSQDWGVSITMTYTHDFKSN